MPEKILRGTHIGAAKSMANVVMASEKIQEYLDGEIWIVFNHGQNDMVWERPYHPALGPFWTKEPIKNKNGTPVVDDYGNEVHAKQNNTIKQLTTRPVKLKERGRGADTSTLTNEIIAKITSYVPNGAFDI